MIEFSNLKEMPKALSKLQFEIKNPNRNKKAYNYYYADMDEVIKCVKEPCNANGFSVVQMPYNDDDVLGVETMLIHSSGEYIKARFGSKIVKHDPQSVGSQISYYRRYSLLSIFNLTQEDDDGASLAKPIQSNSDLATDGQKKFLMSLMGNAEYAKHKDFIETKMSKKQAGDKIAELQDKK